MKFRKKIQREAFARREKAKGTAVYYLPEEHYIGISNFTINRISAHNYAGAITEGWEILCYFERRVDAHWFETALHQRGYHGFRDLINKRKK